MRSASTVEELLALGREFVRLAESGSEHEAGWAHSTYGCSKMILIAYARLLANQYAATAVRVNACCPGFTATDMTFREGLNPAGADMSQDRGQQSAADGADTPVWLATCVHRPTRLDCVPHAVHRAHHSYCAARLICALPPFGVQCQALSSLTVYPVCLLQAAGSGAKRWYVSGARNDGVNLVVASRYRLTPPILCILQQAKHLRS